MDEWINRKTEKKPVTFIIPLVILYPSIYILISSMLNVKVNAESLGFDYYSKNIYKICNYKFMKKLVQMGATYPCCFMISM